MKKIITILLLFAIVACGNIATQVDEHKQSSMPASQGSLTKLVHPIGTDIYLVIPLDAALEATTFSLEKKELSRWIIRSSRNGISYDIFAIEQPVNVQIESELKNFLTKNFSARCKNEEIKYRQLSDTMQNSLRTIHFEQMCDKEFGNSPEYFLISATSLFIISLDNQPDTEQGVSKEKKEIMESIVNNIRLVQ